ncbi:hypothetical protein [Ammoniphilus sp. CFH 90114]|uniref:hypothetical protein n=1 Tax=Ammoniphilus sp. CFH 90114 TaxID=2493665 RepID=UPI0013E90B19|nr:hypothetical protein [Ammoniphilus sp. CFH 90114]
MTLEGAGIPTLFIGTIGVIYSNTLKVFGVMWGPIWLSILFLIIGVGVGLV